MLSVPLYPKVITLSGFHCTRNYLINSYNFLSWLNLETFKRLLEFVLALIDAKRVYKNHNWIGSNVRWIWKRFTSIDLVLMERFYKSSLFVSNLDRIWKVLQGIVNLFWCLFWLKRFSNTYVLMGKDRFVEFHFVENHTAGQKFYSCSLCQKSYR